MTARPVKIVAAKLRLAMLEAGLNPSFLAISIAGKQKSVTLRGGEYHWYTTAELRFMADWLDANGKTQKVKGK